MIKIKSLYLGNFRVFSDTKKLDFLPITCLTGVNSSGKSSVIKALTLLKNIDFKSLPYLIRLDREGDHSLTFDLIKNKYSTEDSITLGLKIYNIILGKNVNAIFHFVKKNDFDEVINKIEIIADKTIILIFKFTVEDRVAVYADLEFFYNNLMNIVSLSNKYEKFKNIILNDKEIPYSFDYKVGESFTLIEDERTGELRSPTEEEVNTQKRKEDNERAMFGEFLKNDPKGKNHLSWLKDFFFSPDTYNQSPLAERWNKLVKEYRPKEILVNNPLLIRILGLSKGEINKSNIKQIINDYLIENGYSFKDENFDDSIDEIVETLLIHSYRKLENKILSDNDSAWEIGYFDEEYMEPISYLLEQYADLVFYRHPFYKLFNPANMLKKKGVITVSLSSHEVTSNLASLTHFISLVYMSIIKDVELVSSDLVHVPLTSLSVERSIGFNHPLHRLISNHKEKLVANSFIRKWLKEFGVCDDFLIETPVPGLGYSIQLLKGKKRIQLVDEGLGTMHLITILLNIAARASSIASLIFEEPEANMHPAWQSKLSEMFLEASKTMGVNFIIETHSEYLIRRLQNFVASKEVNSEDIIIHYIGKKDPKTNDPEVRNITINKNGTLSEEFGSGFIDEADNLAIDLFNLNKLNKN